MRRLHARLLKSARSENVLVRALGTALLMVFDIVFHVIVWAIFVLVVYGACRMFVADPFKSFFGIDADTPFLLGKIIGVLALAHVALGGNRPFSVQTRLSEEPASRRVPVEEKDPPQERVRARRK
jgi:hypothetical protein